MLTRTSDADSCPLPASARVAALNCNKMRAGHPRVRSTGPYSSRGVCAGRCSLTSLLVCFAAALVPVYALGVATVYMAQTQRAAPATNKVHTPSLYGLLTASGMGIASSSNGGSLRHNMLGAAKGAHPANITFLDPTGQAGAQVLAELLSKPPPGPPALPAHSFIITMPDAVRSGRLQMALEHIAAAGLPLPRVIYGSYVNDTEVGCRKNVKYSCRIGLIQAQAQAWRVVVEEGLPSAWVFEDDVLFHDDFTALLPQYWARVPPWYEVVYAQAWSQIGVVAQQDHGVQYPTSADGVVYDVETWGAGAYVISKHGAARLYARYQSLLYHNMKGPSNEQGSLVPWESTPDDFLVTHGLRTAPTNYTYVIFQNTIGQPAKFAGLTLWPEQMVDWYNCKQHGCSCDSEPSLACAHFLPLVFHGLAYQHYHCSTPQAFWKWVAHYKENGPKEGRFRLWQTKNLVESEDSSSSD